MQISRVGGSTFYSTRNCTCPFASKGFLPLRFAASNWCLVLIALWAVTWPNVRIVLMVKHKKQMHIRKSVQHLLHMWLQQQLHPTVDNSNGNDGPTDMRQETDNRPISNIFVSCSCFYGFVINQMELKCAACTSHAVVACVVVAL